MIEGVTGTFVLQQAQVRLKALRQALSDIQDLYKWTSAQSPTDLTGVGLTVADAAAVQSAVADANELAVLYNGGGLGTYTLPYNFSASQRLVIGPQ